MSLPRVVCPLCGAIVRQRWDGRLYRHRRNVGGMPGMADCRGGGHTPGRLRAEATR